MLLGTIALRLASEPLIWEQHPGNDRYKEAVLQSLLQRGVGTRWSVCDQRYEESTNYRIDPVLWLRPGKSKIEIGWTFLARKYWGGRYNAETKQLLLNHAFQFVENVVFFVGQHNVRSQKAMEKLARSETGW